MDAESQTPPALPHPLKPTANIASAAATKSGIPLGSFLLLPELSLSEGYDTNIFSVRDLEQESFIHILSPSLLMKSDWNKHMVKFNAGAEMGSYEADSDQNYKDHWFEGEGRYDLWEGASVFGGTGYKYAHEDRSSPNNQFGLTPTFYSSIHTHLGTAMEFGKVTLRLGGTTERLDYRNVPAAGGAINNAGRDRDLYGAGVRVGYKLSSVFEPFAQFQYDAREYDTQTDRFGFTRHSVGYRTSAGVKFNVAQKLSGEVSGGYLSQSYDDPRFADVTRPDFSALVNWKPTPRTTVSGSIDRSLEETILNGASSYLSTSYGGRINHRVTKRLSTSFNLAYINDDFNGIDRKDDIISTGFGLKYNFTPNVYAAADYRYMMRDSNLRDSLHQDFADFDKNQFFLSLGANLYPVKDNYVPGLGDEWHFTEGGETDLSGFYLGGQSGYGALATNTAGERHSGDDNGEFGDNGFTGGLFGGYGIMLNRWYVGAEMEGEWSDTRWFHQKIKPDSRTFSMNKQDSYGVSGRVGYSLDNGNMLYARGGGVWTDFNTAYTINNDTQNAVNFNKRLPGLRVGLGLDVPVTEHVFMRFDSNYTFYNDYQVVSSGFNENFDPEESLFRMGLGWNFGSRQLPASKEVKLTGFYAGGNLGLGTLNSKMDALHTDAGVGPFPFNASFSDHGFTPGVFLGYGYQFGRIYLAGELEGEASTANWNNGRETTGGGGRTFSSEKKGGYGINGRLGYVLDNGTLVYGRFGIINTRFNTKYAKGNNSATDIDRDDRELGYRFGVGADSPLTESLFLRLEYNYTDYSPYRFTTTQASSDTVEFDNSDSMFRVGVGAHF